MDVGATAKQAVERSRSLVSDQLDQRSTQLGSQVSQTAQDLRKVSDQLRQSGTISSAADLADRGADFIENIGRYLQDSDGDQLIADAESFARERPWAIASGALVLGFAASRVLKASSARRFRSATSSMTSSDMESSYGTSSTTMPTYSGTTSSDDAFGSTTRTGSSTYAT